MVIQALLAILQAVPVSWHTRLLGHCPSPPDQTSPDGRWRMFLRNMVPACFGTPPKPLPQLRLLRNLRVPFRNTAIVFFIRADFVSAIFFTKVNHRFGKVLENAHFGFGQTRVQTLWRSSGKRDVTTRPHIETARLQRKKGHPNKMEIIEKIMTQLLSVISHLTDLVDQLWKVTVQGPPK